MNRPNRSSVLRLSSLLLTTAIVASCMSVGPDFQQPLAELPGAWSDAHGGDVSLNDAQLRASHASVSMQEGFALFADEQLSALQARALENNPDLQSALLSFAQSRVQQAGVNGQHQPMLRTRASAARIGQSETGSATRLISALSPEGQREELINFIADPFSLYQVGFDASWEPDFWGGIQRRLESAQADEDMAQAGVEQVQLALVSEVARVYFSLRGIAQQIALLEADIERGVTLLELLKVRAEAGLSNDFDQLRQEALLAQARSQMPTLLAQQAQSLNTLSLLLGDAPGSLQELLQDRQSWQLAAVPDLALGVPSDLVDTRPDIQAAEARLRAASAQIGVAKAKLYPSITLGAGLGLESLYSQDLTDWGSRQWSIGPQIDLPLFDQGQRKTVVRLRELQAQEAAIDYHQVVLKAWHEVDTALNRYTAQRQSHTQLQSRVASHSQAYEFARTQYDNGVVNYLFVLEAQQGLADARRALSANESEMAVSLVGLFKALGRSDSLSNDALAGR